MQQSPRSFPKILFVNDMPPDSLNLADLVRQLLLGYPPERIAWWHCWQPKKLEVSDLRVGELHRFWLPARLIPNRRLTSLKFAILESMWLPLAARHLRRTILTVKPDVIWVLLYSWSILVAQKAKIPPGPRLHVSIWDFPDAAQSRARLGDGLCDRFVEDLYQLIRKAHSYDGVSKGLLEEITAQTSRKDGILVHSGFEPQHLRSLEASAQNTDQDVLRLAYVGTIISEDSFLEMLAALDRVRAGLGRPLTLEFYGGRNYRSRSWFDPAWMLEHGVFSDQELVQSLQRCSWGIVVMDLEGEDLRYSRYSFPNKIGTYLSAGVPILGFGHPTSSLAEVMQSQRIGKFCSATDRASLEEFLTEALQIPTARNHFREDMIQCARTSFDAQAIRGRLWELWRDSEPRRLSR